MPYTIDRFEDNGWAVLEREDGLTFNVPSDWLPNEAQDGHVLALEADIEGKESRLHFVIDQAETEARLERFRERRAGMPKAPEGDIEL